MSQDHQNPYPRFVGGREAGWGVGLYRNSRRGWLGGVCAGLADYWEAPTWIVRVAAIGLFFVSGSTSFWLYVLAWCVIGKQPSRWEADRPDNRASDEISGVQASAPGDTRARAAEPSSGRLRTARRFLKDAEQRVTAMEGYVTSRRYGVTGSTSRR